MVELCLLYAKLTFLNQAKFSIFDFLSMSTCSDSTAILRIFVWNDFSGGFFSMKEGSYRKTNTTFTVTTFWGYEAKVGLFFRFEVVLRSETASKVKHLWQGGDQWKKIIGQIHLTTNDLFGTLYLASNLLRNRFNLTRPTTQSITEWRKLRDWSSSYKSCLLSIQSNFIIKVCQKELLFPLLPTATSWWPYLTHMLNRYWIYRDDQNWATAMHLSGFEHVLNCCCFNSAYWLWSLLGM